MSQLSPQRIIDYVNTDYGIVMATLPSLILTLDFSAWGHGLRIDCLCSNACYPIMQLKQAELIYKEWKGGK